MTQLTGLRQIGKIAAAVALVWCLSQPASANMIITVGSVTAHAGDVGDFLDVTLTNTGPAVQNIAGDNFEISVAGGSGITFTEVDISTVETYLFATSGAGPIISNFTPHPGPGQIIDGSDFDGSLAGTGTNVGVGAIFGIGRVHFNVASNASLGPLTVTLNALNGATSLSDNIGTNVGFSGVNGTITLLAASTPEPSTLLLVMLALPAFLVTRRLRETPRAIGFRRSE